MELGAVPQPPLDELDRLRGTDLVVGILAAGGNGQTAATASLVREAVGNLSHPARAVLVVDDGAAATRLEEEQSLPVLFCKLSSHDAFGGHQSIFSISGKIGARACGVIASDLRAVTPQWIDRLIRPVLEMDFDLVAPRYARHKWDGLLNRSILSPLNRALYGKRIQNPMGPDLGLSGKLMRQILEEHSAAGPAIIEAAVRGNLRICETHVGPRLQPQVDWLNVSSLVADILGPVFLDMERNAALWQRVRGSQPVPVFGEPEPAPEEVGAVDTGRLIDSFQLGAKNLPDVWSLVLPPSTMLEVQKLARLPPGSFRMPDETWVWIVHDFALAHRLRTINRDHLLRSFTPLYLGWIASYTLEMADASPAMVEARLESLASAFEAGKPYLVSRWRWPDRFNP